MQAIDLMDSLFSLKQGMVDPKLAKKCMVACQQQAVQYLALKNKADQELDALLGKELKKYLDPSADFPTTIHNIALLVQDPKFLAVQSKVMALSQKHINDIDDILDCVIESCDKQMLKILNDVMIIISGVYDILSSKEMKSFLTDVFKHVERHQRYILELLKNRKGQKQSKKSSCLMACLETSKKFNKKLSDLAAKLEPMMMAIMMMMPLGKPTLQGYLQVMATEFKASNGKTSRAATIVKMLIPVLEFVKESDLGLDEIVECFLAKCDTVSLQMIYDVLCIIFHLTTLKSNKAAVKAYTAYVKVAVAKRQTIMDKLGKKIA